MLCVDCMYRRKTIKKGCSNWCSKSKIQIAASDYDCKIGVKYEPTQRKRKRFSNEWHQQFIIMYPQIPNQCLAEIFDTTTGYVEMLAYTYNLKKNKREKYTPILKPRRNG